MAQPILDLSNSANWESIYSHTVNAQVLTERDHIPIPEITIPVLLDQHILAVYTNSNTAKNTWNTAGYLKQKINLGLVVGGLPDAENVRQQRVLLRKINLIMFPRLTSEYALSFAVPFWLRDLSLSIWKYTGINSDSTSELVNQVRVDIAILDDKVDTLLLQN
jgi:hypothetical protein